MRARRSQRGRLAPLLNEGHSGPERVIWTVAACRALMADLPSSGSRAELLRKLRTFTLRSERHGGTHTITPSGELDVATSPKLEAELLRVEATDANSIVLDLSGLDFIGSTGVKVIVDADARSRADSNRLVLLRPSEIVSRVFVICGMGDWPAFTD